MLQTLRNLTIPHKPIYGALAVIYLGARLGLLDKATVYALAAVAYGLLWLGRDRAHDG